MIGGTDDSLTENLRKLAVIMAMKLNTSVIELKNIPMEELLLLSSDMTEIIERSRYGE